MSVACSNSVSIEDSDRAESLRAAIRPARSPLSHGFRVDRRTEPRWRLEGTATLLTLGTVLGTMVELHGLEGAPWWISGVSEKPLPVGARVSIGFSDPSCRPGCGVIERCNPCCDGGFRFAVRFVEATFS